MTYALSLRIVYFILIEGSTFKLRDFDHISLLCIFKEGKYKQNKSIRAFLNLTHIGKFDYSLFNSITHVHTFHLN